VTITQQDLDQRMVTWGLERARRDFKGAMDRGALGETAAGIAAMKGVIEPLITAIAEKLLATSFSRNKTALFQRCYDMDPAVLAFLTLRQCFDRAGPGGASLTSAARSVGSAVEVEGIVRSFQAADPMAVKVVSEVLKQRGSGAGRRATVLRENANRRGHDTDPWTTRDLIMVGLSLIDLMMGSCRLFEVSQTRKGRKTTDMIRLTTEAAKWLDDRTDKQGFLMPAYLPMLEPPTPWTSLRGGGYRGALEGKIALTKRTFPGQIDALKGSDLRPVYASVNAIQETPWQVNGDVLDVMKQVWDSGRPFPGVTNREDLPMPPKAWTGDPSEDELRSWKYQARTVYEANAKAQSARFTMSRLLSVAEELRDADGLYFPHQLDFRGRAYALPVGLSPQGPDESRALLCFRPISGVGDSTGVSAGRWLRIHGANCYGVDKVSFSDREQWVNANSARILATASNPLNDLWWTDADKPWGFLAFCYDFNRCLSGVEQSRVPIAMDGSCNGLQHYAALLRDPVAGEATNLTPSETPQDIYGRVATRTAALLRDRAEQGDWVARSWLDFGIDRRITKRPVMVLPYGGTRMSCIQYTREAVVESITTYGKDNPFGDEVGRYSAQLAMVIWEAIGDVVVSARAAMEWLQGLARVHTSAGLPLMWQTPSGFHGWQAYAQTKMERINTVFGTLGRVQGAYYGDLPLLDGGRQSLAFPPNFVHSLDASALALTIAESRRQGITQFACIHDSFGTTADNADKLAKIIREQFVGMYENHDPLHDLWINATRMGLDVPPPPAKGTLDLQEVHNSLYFFA
jgi:DNA-directed RNA polymerase